MMFYLICWVRHQSDLLTYVLCEVTDERLIHTGACLWWHICYFIPEVNRTWFPSALQIYFIYLLFRCVFKKCLKRSHLRCDVFYHLNYCLLPHGLSPLTFLYTPQYTSMSPFTCYLYRSVLFLFFFFLVRHKFNQDHNCRTNSALGWELPSFKAGTAQYPAYLCPHMEMTDQLSQKD